MKNRTKPEGKPFYNTIIPQDWEIRKLIDCCKIKGQYGINASAVEYSDELPTYLRITDIDDDGNYTDIKKVSVSGNDTDKFILEQGDIVFVRTGATVGKNYLFNKKDGKLIFAGFLIRFRPDERILSPQFLRNFTLTKTYWDWVKTISMRSGQPGINAEEYGSLQIPLPSPGEQKAIVDFLITWDIAIDKMQRQIIQLKHRNKWLIQQLLSGKKRLKGFNEKWKEIHIRDVAEEVSIRNKKNEHLTVLSCTKYNGLIPSLEYFGKKIFSDDLSTYKIVPLGHFAYATNHIEEGSIGYQDKFEEALISPMYTIFKTDSTINDGFLFRLLKSHHLIFQYNARMEGSIERRGGLRWDAFSIIKIHLPAKIEQTAIVEVLQTADNEVRLLKTVLNKLKEQKKGLMQVLLTGQTRLKF